jgi:MtN3 and saliva related transmembrane protein
METTSLVGFAAGFLTTVAFIPQAVKIWRSKSAADVSLTAFLAFTLGVGLWIAYGVLKQEPPIIVWNGVTLLIALAILGMKVKYR